MKKLIILSLLILTSSIFYPISTAYADFANGASVETNDLPFVGSQEALVLDRTQNQYFFDPTKNSLTTDGDFTIEAWIKLNQFYSGGSWLVTKDDGSSNRQFGFAAADIQKLAFQVRGIGGINSNNASLSTNTWTYVAVVWHADTQNADFYINGLLDSIVNTSAVIPSSGNAAELEVGRRQDGNTGTMDGKISEVRIWNVARTASQITNNYNIALSGNELGLIAYYPKWSSTDLNVPPLKQISDPWQNQVYDSANLWSPLNPTINRWGCALTSAAMVFQYHGLTKLPDNTTLDPGTVNAWLKTQLDGYVGNGYVNWLALSRLSKLAKESGHNPSFTKTALVYSRVETGDKTQLTSDLQNGLPGILEVPGHFVVAKGINGDTYDINDPYHNRSLLNDGYGNTFLRLGRYTPSDTDLSYILLVLPENINAVLKNSNGDEVGTQYIQQPIVDPLLGTQNNGPPIQILYLPQPETGTYQLVLSSPIDDLYSFKSYLYDVDGDVKINTINGILGGSTQDLVELHFNHDNADDSSAQPQVTFESTLDDINEAENTGLIKSPLVKSIANLLNKAWEDSQEDKVELAIIKLDALKVLLNSLRNKGVDEIAYQILIADVNALISSLENL